MFNEQHVPFYIAAGAGVAVLILFYLFNQLSSLVPEEKRQHKDPIPMLLKPFWPLINLVGNLIGQYLPLDYHLLVQSRLRRSELIFLMNSEQFFAIQLIMAIATGNLAWLALKTINMPSTSLSILIGLIGFAFPLINLLDRQKKREKHIVRDLPVYLDYITMGVQSGLNFGASLMQAVDKGPPGPLKRELAVVQRDIRQGIPRIEALRNLEERLQMREITSLVTNMAQADKTGADIADLLRIQGEQRLYERFHRAEKMATEAPVKLLFPLVVFIFPTTFLVIAFPIIMKFIYEL